MEFTKSTFFSVLAVVVLQTTAIKAQTSKEKKTNQEFELEVEAEYRYFYDKAQFQNQKSQFPSIAFTPEYSIDWNKGNESINFTGFFRIDVDNERTHADIRELYYQKAKGKWELNIGLKKVYWGVAESNHLVDIINQTDAVESFDGEKKLGQPMVQYTYSTDSYGTFALYYLPYHRKRNFSREKGRLRFSTIIDKNDVNYESGAEEWRQDLAFRWSHYLGAFDIGVSHFYGNGREPLYNFDPFGNVNAFYPVINQTGLDVQATHNAFLWKFESIYRTAKAQDFFALVAGLEYTFSNIDGNGLDIGVLGEYLYDEREELALNSLQNDVFFGSRIAFNDSKDSSILIGGLADLRNRSKIFSMEASRRIGNSWKAELEARLFITIDTNELILSYLQEDSFLKVSLTKYF
ncbi:MAG: hypothetical protein JKY69_01640 [Flavobacteriaceae bacterium]|nr:hypothetical protein [Flavobacteriaceae bacterium]